MGFSTSVLEFKTCQISKFNISFLSLFSRFQNLKISFFSGAGIVVMRGVFLFFVTEFRNNLITFLKLNMSMYFLLKRNSSKNISWNFPN